jgi:hypothetical protein
MRARILRDFKEKEYIEMVWNDPELYLKHPIEF